MNLLQTKPQEDFNLEKTNKVPNRRLALGME